MHDLALGSFFVAMLILPSLIAASSGRNRGTEQQAKP